MVNGENKNGHCCKCGRYLSFYAMKLVEQNSDKIACYWPVDYNYKGCAETEGKPPEDGIWVVYSDG